LTLSPISDNPTDNEVKRAKELLLEIVSDFPFVDKAGHANTIAAKMLPVIRPLINLAPMAVFDKPQSGTGASLLADVISVVATGRPAATMGVPRSEEEWEEKLNSHLLEGRALCVIDNVDQ
jgi:putative DNA primase/helicase